MVSTTLGANHLPFEGEGEGEGEILKKYACKCFLEEKIACSRNGIITKILYGCKKEKNYYKGMGKKYHADH